MAGDSTKIKLGACWVTFGTITGVIGEVVDLGYTKGGVTLTIDTSTYPVTVDQEGDTPVAEVITGRICVVGAPLAETSYVKLKKMIPDSTYNAVTGLLQIKSGIGDDLMDYADELVLTAKDDANDIVTVYKAAPIVSLQAVYLPNQERIWPTQFRGYIPESGHTYEDILLGLQLAT